MAGGAGDPIPAGGGLIVDWAQRWRGGRDSYRPAGEPIVTSAYEVAAIDTDNEAKRFVLEHHYSGSYVAARERFGLYRGEALVGVAVFSQPQNDIALDVLPGGRETGIELGRFILLDDVPANGETWFLARCLRAMRRIGYVGVVSFSDPVARRDSTGRIVMPGHVGTIYQASNATYLGRTKAERKHLLADGTVFPNRTLAKIRKRDKGWEYGVERLVGYGAAAPRAREDLRVWLARWLPRLTRSMEHGGNLKYAFDLRRRGSRARLPESKPYFKITQLTLI
jgi:hypothetical protein